MHPEVARFIVSCRDHIPTGAVVYEVGSLNVNGQARDLISGLHTWTGIDLIEGPGVDIVGDACDILPTLPPCDVIVCCEVLEHYEDWPTLVWAMCDQLNNGGTLILTCAGTGRPPHAADGTMDGPHPGEYYANVTLEEVERAARLGCVRQLVGEEGPPGDTRYLGRKVVN